MIPSPYLTKQEMVQQDLEEVDMLVARIAPALKKITSIVKRAGVKNFMIYVDGIDGKINFVMVDKDNV